jgi:hypothetical protein
MDPVCVPWAPLALTLVLTLYISTKFAYVRHSSRIYAGIDMLILMSQVAYLRDMFKYRKQLYLCKTPF